MLTPQTRAFTCGDDPEDHRKEPKPAAPPVPENQPKELTWQQKIFRNGGMKL